MRRAVLSFIVAVAFGVAFGGAAIGITLLFVIITELQPPESLTAVIAAVGGFYLIGSSCRHHAPDDVPYDILFNAALLPFSGVMFVFGFHAGITTLTCASLGAAACATVAYRSQRIRRPPSSV